MAAMASPSRYRVTFHNQGKVYEIYASRVNQGSLLGFIEVEGLLFGERSQVVVDPSEESLKAEFKGVRRVYVPLHAVVRIDEVEKEGVSRITKRSKDDATIAVFPTPVYSGTEKDPAKN
jgi:hypothetical protein